MNQSEVKFSYRKVNFKFVVTIASFAGSENNPDSCAYSTSLSIEETNKVIHSTSFRIYGSPTRNCQTQSISGLDCIIGIINCQRGSFYGETPINGVGKAGADKIIKTIFKLVKETMHSSKTLFIVDYANYISDKVKSTFDVMMVMPYVSTNNSKMNLGIIRVKNYK